MKRRGPGRGRLVRSKDAKGAAIYVGDWTDARGVRHRKTLSTDRRVAERMLAAIIRDRDLATKGLLVEDGGTRKLAEVVAAFLAELRPYRRPSYVETTDRALNEAMDFLGPVCVQEVTVARMLDYRRARLADGIANRTINIVTDSLRRALAWAVRAALIGVNPLEHLRGLPQTRDALVRPTRALTDEEVGAFLAAADADDAARRSAFLAETTIANGTKGLRFEFADRRPPVPQRPMFQTLAVCGFRWSEACALLWSDLDEEAGTFTVHAEHAKSHKTRTAPVPPYLVAELRALRKAQALALGRPVLPTDHVFLSRRGSPWAAVGEPNAIRLFDRIRKAANIPKGDKTTGVANLHALRATASTYLLRHGVNLPLVSAALGHADVRTTMRHYVKLHVADTAAAVASVPPIVAKKRGEGTPADVRAVAGGSESGREVGSNLAMSADDATSDDQMKSRKLDFRPSLREERVMGFEPTTVSLGTPPAAPARSDDGSGPTTSETLRDTELGPAPSPW